MSRGNVEVVRGAFADWNRRDWRAWMAKHHADMVCVPPKDWPERERLENCEAWFRQVQLMLEPWDEQHLEIDNVQTVGAVVVVTFRWVARARESQIDVDIPMAGNYTITDGKITRMEFFSDPSEALDAVGWREWENAEQRGLAEAGFEALNSGDLEAFLALTAEDVEFTSMVAEAEGTTFRGHDGVRAWWETVRGAFEDVRWDLLDVRGSGDRGVLHFLMAGTLGSVPVEQTMWQAIVLRDGKAIWWAFFRSEREALEALGLRE
jgi:ketosteroid isomerase-like protein